MQDTINELDTAEHIDNGGDQIWEIPCSPSADSFGLVYFPGDASSTDDVNYGPDDENDDENDDESEAEVISEGTIKTDDGESEEMPASMESWDYQMSSCSSSGSEYEYGFLPGMQKTMTYRRAISNAIKLAADDGNDILMPDEDLSDNGGELSSWGCPAYGKFPSKSTSPTGFPENSSCVPFGTLHPPEYRKVSSVAVPFQWISQQHQQQSQQKQQIHIPQSPVHTYHHQQVGHGCYQYQPPDTHPAGWISINNTVAAAGSSVAHPHSAPREDLGLWLVQYPNSPSGPTDPTPSPPLERRGGRPIPPSEMDLRWNIWTVGNLDIRCTASGVGVKHLKQVLYRDDNYTGYRRSKWTHKRLSAEVMVRRANQEATNRVVGRPKDFLAHQGWWFYIGAL